MTIFSQKDENKMASFLSSSIVSSTRRTFTRVSIAEKKKSLETPSKGDFPSKTYFPFARQKASEMMIRERGWDECEWEGEGNAKRS